jgi:hypothetical protein
MLVHCRIDVASLAHFLPLQTEVPAAAARNSGILVQ